MRHYAKLCGVKASAADLNTKIDTLVSQLGLAEQQDTIVGDIFLKGLSGGQKRRLSVALEALTDPVNLFLDEPTSGLGRFLDCCDFGWSFYVQLTSRTFVPGRCRICFAADGIPQGLRSCCNGASCHSHYSPAFHFHLAAHGQCHFACQRKAHV